MDEQQAKSAKTLTAVVYGLQGAAFFVGITGVVAIIINYVKLGDIRGSWLESHFRWQIRTFWFSLLWAFLGGLTVFLGIGYLVLLADGVWVIYRIVKGWLNLNDRKPMYA